MNEQQQQEFLEQKLKEFTDKLTDVARDIIGDVYCDYLPHVMSDTECNATFRAQDMIKKLLGGNFVVTEDSIYVDGNYLLNMSQYDKVAQGIYNAAKEKIENAAIAELKREVEKWENIAWSR